MGRIKKTPNIQAKLAERKKKFENNFDVVNHIFLNQVVQQNIKVSSAIMFKMLLTKQLNTETLIKKNTSTIVYLCVLYFQRNCLAVFELLQFAVIIWYCPRFCPGPRTVSHPFIEKFSPRF